MRPYEPPARATARRPRWEDLPAPVRRLVQHRLGEVVAARSQSSGFTPGFASRLTTATGSWFVKAVAVDDPFVHPSYVREAEVNAALPPGVPAPRLQWSQTGEGWLVLCFEDVEGRTPSRPWRADELQRVTDALTPMAQALTPPPDLPGLETTADLEPLLSRWRRGTPPPDGWDPSVLVALESEWAERAAGSTAAHFDLREDNVLLTDDAVLVCDWNWLAVAAPWVDLVGLLPSAHAEGHDTDALLAAHPLTADVDPRSVDAFLAALAGYYTSQASQPCPDTSPWMRVHQAWWRDATLGWLAQRLGG